MKWSTQVVMRWFRMAWGQHSHPLPVPQSLIGECTRICCRPVLSRAERSSLSFFIRWRHGQMRGHANVRESAGKTCAAWHSGAGSLQFEASDPSIHIEVALKCGTYEPHDIFIVQFRDRWQFEDHNE